MKFLLIATLGVTSAWTQTRGLENSPSWQLSTDDTRIVVAVEQGKPVVRQLGETKSGSNWLLGAAPDRLPSSVIVRGASVATDWRYEGGTFQSSSGQLVLRFSNSAPALELQSIWQASPGRGPVEHWLNITNKSQTIITIGHQDSLALSHIRIPSDELMDAWWIKRGGGNATTEGGTLVQSIDKHSNETLTSDPTDGASPVPWLAVQVGITHGLYVGWESSSIGRIRFHGDETRTPAREPAQLNIEVGNTTAFRTDIQAGETLLIPAAFVGCYKGDVDDGSYTLHRFVLDKLVPRFPEGYAHPTLAYNLYLDAGGANADEKSVLRSAALAEQLGFETFVVDAMWFVQDGDWRWDPRRFPHGAQPIEEFLHSHGMKLGLWMAYTHGSGSSDSDAMSVARYPTWFAAPPKLDPEGHINWNALIDLGNDPARDWAEKTTQRVVSEYKLDYFKTDYSPIVTNCQQSSHHHHYGVDVSYWSTLGYYAVQESLIRKFPNVMLEGCSGSGHIKDFGDIRRVHMIAMNDTLSSLPDRQAIYDSTFAFPPAVLMDYTYENYYNRVSDAPEPYLWRSAMMGVWQIDPTDSATWTPNQRAQVKKATQIYKSWIRPILQDVEVHHILPRPDGYHWDGMFYWSPSINRGTLYIFRPNNDTPTQHVLLKGLARDAKYKVRAEDHSVAEATYSGTELMDGGLSIRLPGRYTSDLVYLEKIH